jgi:tetratricopeptide (TPR) repeat protein
MMAAAALAAWVSALHAAEPSPQQTEQRCHDYTLRADQQIASCTTLIGLYGNAAGNRGLLALAFLARGSSHFRTSNRERALADYREAIRLDTVPIASGEREAALYNDRCWARAVAQLELDEALKDCDEALRLRADFVAALDSRAFLQLRRGRFREALIDYNAALKGNPTDPYSLFGRGIAKLRTGDAQGAKADMAAAAAVQAGIAAEFLSFGVTP